MHAPDAPSAPATATNWQTEIASRSPATVPALDDFEAPEETPADRVFAVLDANRDAERAIVKLFRVTGANRYEWCDDYPVADFEAGGFKMVREVWGPGEYEIRLYGVNPRTGAFGVLAKPRVSIAPTPGAAKPVQVASAVPPEMVAMLRQMQEQNAAIVNALAQRPDPLAGMQTTIAILAQARELFGGSQAKSGIKEAVEAIRELRAVNDEINPAGAAVDPDNPMALLPGVLDLVKTAMANRGADSAQMNPAPLVPAVTLPPMLAARESPAAAAPVAGNASPTAHALPATATDDERMNVLALMTLRGYLAQLCQLADNGSPPTDGATLIYEKLPDDLVDLMELPNWWELLVSVAGEFATEQRRAWFTAARDGALRMLASDAPVVGRPLNQG